MQSLAWTDIARARALAVIVEKSFIIIAFKGLISWVYMCVQTSVEGSIDCDGELVDESRVELEIYILQNELISYS